MTPDGDGAVLLEVLTATPAGVTAHAVAVLVDVRVGALARALADALRSPGPGDGARCELVGPDGDRWPADATLRQLQVRDSTTVRLVVDDRSEG